MIGIHLSARLGRVDATPSRARLTLASTRGGPYAAVRSQNAAKPVAPSLSDGLQHLVWNTYPLVDCLYSVGNDSRSRLPLAAGLWQFIMPRCSRLHLFAHSSGFRTVYGGMGIGLLDVDPVTSVARLRRFRNCGLRLCSVLAPSARNEVSLVSILVYISQCTSRYMKCLQCDSCFLQPR